MKKLSGIVGFIVFCLFFNSAFAAEVILFDETFVRGTGKPQKEERYIDIQGIEGPALFRVTNGSTEALSYDQLSSAEIRLNGNVIFYPSDFNQGISSLEVQADLQDGHNILEILPRSKPNSYLRLEVIKDIEAQIATVVDSQGISYTNTDPESPLLGVEINIPPDALNENILLSMHVKDVEHELPEELSSAGFVIDFGPDGTQFSSNIQITLPYLDDDNNGILDGTDIPEENVFAVTYNGKIDIWLYLKKTSQDTVNNTVTFETTHFSDFLAAGMSSDNISDHPFFFSIDGLSFVKIAALGRDDIFRPSYLKYSLYYGMSFDLEPSDFYCYGDEYGNASWSGDANYTEDIMENLILCMESKFNEMKSMPEPRPFILVTHSWGTVLSFLTLSYSNVVPDLYITLSDPMGTENTNYSGDEFLDYYHDYDNLNSLVASYVKEQTVDTINKLKLIPHKPIFKKWINYWFTGDIFSGPIKPYFSTPLFPEECYTPPYDDNLFEDKHYGYSVINDITRTVSKTIKEHSISSIDGRGLIYLFNEEGYWLEHLYPDQQLLTRAESLRIDVKNDIESCILKLTKPKLAVEVIGNTATFTWDKVIGATGYELLRENSYVNSDSYDDGTCNTGNELQIQVTFNEPFNDIDAMFVVRAYNDRGEVSKFSNPVHVGISLVGNDNPYFNFNDGDKYLYDSRPAAGTTWWENRYSIQEYEYNGLINGKNYFTILGNEYHQSGNNYDWVHNISESIDGNIYILNNSGEVKYYPNFADMSVGYQWTVSGFEPGVGSFTHTFKIESKNDTVKVPAGEFSNCVRLYVKKYWPNDSQDSRTGKEWFAPGIGSIKEENNLYKNVLVKAKVGSDIYSGLISVTAPATWSALSENGGSSIEWNTGESVKLDYTLDGGENWTRIASNVSNGYFQWTPPYVSSDKQDCFIRVTSNVDPDKNGVSGRFTICDENGHALAARLTSINYTCQEDGYKTSWKCKIKNESSSSIVINRVYFNILDMSDTGAFSSYMWTGSLSIPAGQEATIPETFYMVFFEPLDDNELDLGLEVKYTVNPCVKYYVKNNFAIPVSESAVRNCVEEESGVEIVSATVDKYYVDDSCDPTTLTVTVKNTGEQKIIEVIVYEIYGTKVCSIHNPQQIMLRSGGQYSFDFIITGYGHSPGVRTIDISAYNYSDQQYKESASVDFYLREAGDDCCP